MIALDRTRERKPAVQIFAEADNVTVGVITSFLTAVVGGAAAWLWTVWKESDDRKQKRKDKDELAAAAREKEEQAREDKGEETIIGHQQRLIERMAREIAALQAEAKSARQLVVTLTGHVMYLEGVMEAKNMKFRRLELPIGEVGSGTHRPVPEENTE